MLLNCSINVTTSFIIALLTKFVPQTIKYSNFLNLNTKYSLAAIPRKLLYKKKKIM